MKLLFDLFPIILFFVAYKLVDIYAATAVAIAASFAQIGWLKLRAKPIEPMQWTGLAIIAVFGGLTLLWHDETFIKWKPTVLYWLMGGTLLVGQLVFRKNFIQSLMGKQIELPAPVWRQLNWAWTTFFAAMGLLNLWVAYRFDTDTWVNFKLFGGLGLMFAFVIAQALFLSRHMKEGDAAPEDSQP